MQADIQTKRWTHEHTNRKAETYGNAGRRKERQTDIYMLKDRHRAKYADRKT